MTGITKMILKINFASSKCFVGSKRLFNCFSRDVGNRCVPHHTGLLKWNLNNLHSSPHMVHHNKTMTKEVEQKGYKEDKPVKHFGSYI
jgi:hypothetical protein